MAESVLMGELSWPEFEAKTKAKAPFFLPVGATEQHGPHLPLNVDVVLPTSVAVAVANNVGGVVAPTIPYGYKSQPRTGGGQAFPGRKDRHNGHDLERKPYHRRMGGHVAPTGDLPLRMVAPAEVREDFREACPDAR